MEFFQQIVIQKHFIHIRLALPLPFFKTHSLTVMSIFTFLYKFAYVETNFKST